MRFHATLFLIPALACLALLAWVLVDARDGSAQESPAPGLVEGIVTDVDGAPIQGALVSDGVALVVTGADGLFLLSLANEDEGATFLVRASGYADWTRAVAEVSEIPLDIVLEAQDIRALYLNPMVTNTQPQFNRLIGIIDQTSVNAIVIDIKEEWIWYDTQVAFFREAGTVRPLLDLPSLLRQFHEHGIYTIARLVLFQDSMVAEAYPDLAIRDTTTGELWRDMNGVAWVNPMAEALWVPNIDLAVEAAGLGFDEIQYDYIRFPTDGDLSTMDFGTEFSQAGRERAIEGFLTQSRERLLPTGARQSADVFGFTMVVDDDLGIGQNFVQLADLVDYLSPMIYPSHYSDGQFGLPGHPNDFPYEVVSISLQAGAEKLDGNARQMRPWLQDFDRDGMTPYGAEDVLAQIRAAAEVGTSGWMLWDPENRYDTGHLEPEPDAGALSPVAWLALPSRVGSGHRKRSAHLTPAAPT